MPKICENMVPFVCKSHWQTVFRQPYVVPRFSSAWRIWRCSSENGILRSVAQTYLRPKLGKFGELRRFQVGIYTVVHGESDSDVQNVQKTTPGSKNWTLFFIHKKFKKMQVLAPLGLVTLVWNQAPPPMHPHCPETLAFIWSCRAAGKKHVRNCR